MFESTDQLLFSIIQLIFGIGLTFISLMIVVYQFRPAIFPVPSKQRLWRSTLVALMFAVGVIGILLIINVFTEESIFSSVVLIPVFCIVLPITEIIVGVSVYLQYGWIAQFFKKFNIRKGGKPE